jgi:hypothetical protein
MEPPDCRPAQPGRLTHTDLSKAPSCVIWTRAATGPILTADGAQILTCRISVFLIMISRVPKLLSALWLAQRRGCLFIEKGVLCDKSKSTEFKLIKFLNKKFTVKLCVLLCNFFHFNIFGMKIYTIF